MKKLFALLPFLGLLALTPPNINSVTFGTRAAPFYTVLLDGGPQQSVALAVDNSILLSVVCTSQDAGTNAALGAISVLGSNDAVNFVQLGSSQSLPGVSGIVAWDPISSGMSWIAVAVDGGGTVAGTVQCTYNGKDQYP